MIINGYMKTIYVRHAYGRTTQDESEIRALWEDDKDFAVYGNGGGYVNASDADTYGIDRVFFVQSDPCLPYVCLKRP